MRSVTARWAPGGLVEAEGILQQCCWGGAQSDQQSCEHPPRAPAQAAAECAGGLAACTAL